MENIKKFEVKEEYRKVLRAFFGTKPFIDVISIIPILSKEIVTEQEINSVINLLGQYPYDEVAEFFETMQNNVSEVAVQNETAE